MRQDVACHFCGSVDHSPYLSESSYELVKCQRCGLLYVTPRPPEESITEAAKLGVHGVHDGRPTGSTGRFSTKRVDASIDILNSLFTSSEFEPNANWLDIGAGHGELLEAVRTIWGDTVATLGLEPNMAKAQSAQGRGLDVAYFDVANHGDRYSVISAFNVFAHLPNPRATLLQWAELLRPDGVFLLQTSDTAELPSFDHPRPLELPDHLSYSSEKLVTSILADVGLDVEKVIRRPLIDWRGSRWLREAAKAATPWRQSSFSSRDVTARKLRIIIKARRI